MPFAQAHLDAIHGFELAEGLHRVDMLLVGGAADLVGLVVVLLALDQWLLLGGFHLPGDGRHVEVLHAQGPLVLGGGHVGRLHCRHHAVH